MMKFNNIYLQDCLQGLKEVPTNNVTTIHTSPPYNIGKDYSGYSDSLARKEYLEFIKGAITECYRTLKPGGNLFWQTGYTTFEDDFIFPIDHLTFDLFLDAGFKLKDRIIWRYFGGMSFKSKFTNKHETILWWVKPGGTAYFDVFPIREKSKELDPRNNLFGRNPGNVWEVDRVAYGSIQQTSHIAVFPEEISDKIILSTTGKDDICMDPFSGSGTLCKVAKSRERRYIGFEIAKQYYDESIRRLSLTPTGEYKNIVSTLMKLHAFEDGKANDLHKIFDYILLLISSFDITETKLFADENEIDALMERRDIFDKKRKIEFWSKTDDFFVNDRFKKEPLRLFDDCFLYSYKLTRTFNGVMRIFNVLNWIDQFKQNEHNLYDDLTAIIEEEDESFKRKGNMITLLNRNKQIKTNGNNKGAQSAQGSFITQFK